jgi:CO/xanthine dehydrogenase FAD-binding subunit
MAPAAYCRPCSVGEAVALKAERNGSAVFLAGGTDLMLRLRRPFHGLLIDIGAAGLDRVCLENGNLHIGATVTAHRLVTDPFLREHAPLLAAAASQLGSPQVRSRATVGGNAANASPAADLPCALAALDAAAVLRGPHGERRVPVLELASGPGRTVCAGDELIAGFDIPVREQRCAFLKLGLREAQSIAVASAAVSASLDSGGCVARLAITCGSVAPRIVRAVSVEAALTGTRPEPAGIEVASRLVIRDISPISDVRAGSGYRSAVMIGLVRRALLEALPCA